MGTLNVESVDRLDVQVRFRAVAGVAAQSELLTDLNAVTHPNPYAAMLEMAERNYTAAATDHDVISGERKPAPASTAVLRQRVADRRYPAVREVIGLSVLRSHDGSCDGREHRTAESDKVLRGFRTHEGAEGERGCSGPATDRRRDIPYRAGQSSASAPSGINRRDRSVDNHVSALPVDLLMVGQ